MKSSDIAKQIGKSKTHVYRTINDENYNKHDFGKIMLLLNFEEDTLKEMFLDERFLELCTTGIEKSRSAKIREFASHCKAIHLYFKGKAQ